MASDPADQRWQFDLARFAFGLFLLIISLRFVAIPFILLWGIRPPRFRFASSLCTGIPLLIALASPIDIGMPRFGTVMGNERGGVRVVRVVSGMPRHTYLIENYGEFVSTGCSGLPCVYQPTYWIVWWSDA